MPLILGTNSIKDTGYNVDNSLRFDDGSSDYLNQTFSSNGTRTTWTFSTWIKRANLGSDQRILSCDDDASGNQDDFIKFLSGDTFQIGFYNSGFYGEKTTNRVFRDVSAWYHFVIVWDTTNGTADDRIRLYVNGVRETSFSSSTNPSSSANSFINSTSYPLEIGRRGLNGTQYINGYLAETVFVDGTALDPTSFGEFDEDSSIWKPIDVSGLTFGTNGFYLDFENSGSLGADLSGNGNNFTVNNLTAIDQSTDTCTLNYSTLNPLATSSFNDLSEGSLKITGNTATNDGETFSTFVMPNATAKWYWELKCTNKYSGGNPKFGFIQAKRGFRLQNGGAGYGGGASGTLDIMVRPDGKTLENGSTSGSAVIGTWDTGDILSFALDSVNGAFYVGINGTWQTSGNPESGASKTGAVKTWTPTDSKCDDGQAVCIGSYNGSVTEANFGSPSFAISSGNTDADGYGNFEYSGPSGYYSLNTKNLAEYG